MSIGPFYNKTDKTLGNRRSWNRNDSEEKVSVKRDLGVAMEDLGVSRCEEEELLCN